jgi:hypothetical protein
MNLRACERARVRACVRACVLLFALLLPLLLLILLLLLHLLLLHSNFSPACLARPFSYVRACVCVCVRE